MYLKLNDQIGSTQITLSIRELVIMQVLTSKLLTPDQILNCALPTFCQEEDIDSILEFAKELGEELDTLVAESVLTLPSIDP